MNIFRTNDCPIQSAREHCDVHVTKMILEYSQLLSTVLRLKSGIPMEIYRKPEAKKKKLTYVLPSDTIVDEVLVDNKVYIHTHENHPSVLWVMESISNYEWLVECLQELHQLFHDRRGKYHKSLGMFEYIFIPPFEAMEDKGLLSNYLAISEENYPFVHLFHKDEPLVAYQVYMNIKLREWEVNKGKKYCFPEGEPEWFSHDLKDIYFHLNESHKKQAA
tara:strand:- start:62073 stop:62729 length:657 start_codon:yes stop_codon:yes gene_type:complete